MNVILRLDASERYLRNRLDSFAAELLAVDHPSVRYEDIRINEQHEVVIPLDVYFDDADYAKHTLDIPAGERTVIARPMFEAMLTIGPVIEITTKGTPADAPPLLQDISRKADDLIFELLNSKIILHLGSHPKAVLEITDHISCYTVKEGLLRKFVRDPWTDA